MNVLIIDDDAEDRLLFCEALNEIYPHAICTGVNSCQRIPDTIARIQPDIIFIDGHMQPKSGAECLEEINTIIDRNRVKVIIHSGSLSQTELNQFKVARVDHILLKASSFTELKSNIQFVIETYLLRKPE